MKKTKFLFCPIIYRRGLGQVFNAYNISVYANLFLTIVSGILRHETIIDACVGVNGVGGGGAA